MIFYKATRPDGTDFRTGTVNYLAGGIISHPSSDKMIEGDASTYLSVSISPEGTMLGGSWPCRLFEVDLGNGEIGTSEDHSFKRTTLSLMVIREIESHRVFGPNGADIARIIEKCAFLTDDQAVELFAAGTPGGNAARNAAWDAAESSARNAAWSAARNAARNAAWDAARNVAWDAAWGVVWSAARNAAWGAILALIVKDRISEEHFNILYEPWASVMES